MFTNLLDSGNFSALNSGFDTGVWGSGVAASSGGLFSNWSANKAMTLAGGGLQIAGGLTSLFGVRDQWNNINQQEQLIQDQSALQIQQIQASQDAANIQSMQQANKVMSAQVAQANTSGAALSSGSVFAALADTSTKEQNRQFMNNMNATAQRANAYYQKSAMLQQAYEAKNAAGFNAIGGLISTGIGVGTLLF